MSAPKRKTVAKVAPFKGGKMLMGLRRDDGRRCFPGGHLDDGESPEDGAARELLEETGLSPESLQMLATKDVKDGKVRVHGFAATVSGEPDEQDDPDAEFVRFEWVDPAAVPSQIRNNLHSDPDVLLDLIAPKHAWSDLMEHAA